MKKSSYINPIFAPTLMFPRFAPVFRRALILLFAFAVSMSAQTWEVGGQQTQPQQQQAQAPRKKAGKGASVPMQSTQQQESGIGTFG
ncbi:MAG: hypothetical protein DMG64_13385, partial [Acidobacteria bacterium]